MVTIVFATHATTVDNEPRGFWSLRRSAFPIGERQAKELGERHKDDHFDDKRVLIIGHRATQYGLEHFINRVPLVQTLYALAVEIGVDQHSNGQRIGFYAGRTPQSTMTGRRW